MNEANIALFLDWESFDKALRQHYKTDVDFVVLFDAAKEYGILKIARAYANWQLENLKPQISEIQKHNIKNINVPHDSKGRSSSSVKLALDALTLAYQRPQINTFLLLSGDNNLMPLAHMLKHLKRQVIFIGLEPEVDFKISQQLIDSLLLYDKDIVSLQVNSNQALESTTTPLTEAFTGLENLLRQTKSKGMSLRQLEFVMQHLYGFQPQENLNMSFSDVMSAMVKENRVKLFSKGNDTFAILPNFAKITDDVEIPTPKKDTLTEVQFTSPPVAANKETVMSEPMKLFLEFVNKQEKQKKLVEILNILKKRHGINFGKEFREELTKVEQAGYVVLRKNLLGREIFVSKGQKKLEE